MPPHKDRLYPGIEPRTRSYLPPRRRELAHFGRSQSAYKCHLAPPIAEVLELHEIPFCLHVGAPHVVQACRPRAESAIIGRYPSCRLDTSISLLAWPRPSVPSASTILPQLLHLQIRQRKGRA